MYIPVYFKMEDTAEIRTFVKAHPSGMHFVKWQSGSGRDSCAFATH
jgi:predicted FMN-binding regulatory protein PaiB